LKGIRERLKRIKMKIEILILYFLALMLFILLMILDKLGERVEEKD